MVLAFAAVIYTLYAADNRPPNFKFLKGATLIKVDTGIDPAGDYAGKAYAYEVKGTFNEVVHRADDELRELGGWAVDESDHSPSKKIGVDPRAKAPSFGYYQLFLNENGGVEVVDQEPAQWVMGQRQTTWTSGSGTNKPGVVTIFVTRRNASMEWWLKIRRKLEDFLP